MKFDDLLTYMNKVDGDYLISAVINYKVSLHSFLLDSFAYNPAIITFYPKILYWRYKYNASTRSGVLFEVDSDGNAKPRRRRRC